jgi:hypothetical protein
MRQEWTRGRKRIRAKGTNSERSGSPGKGKKKRWVEGAKDKRPGSLGGKKRGTNPGETGGIPQKRKLRQGGKRSGEGGDQLGPVQRLMIVAASLWYGTHATEGMRVGALTRASRDNREGAGGGGRGGWKILLFEEAGRGGRRGWKILLFGRNGGKETRLECREDWGAVALCPALVGTGVLVWRHDFALRN